MILGGFTKLFNTIITSSVWSEDDKTRIMWITLLALADANGRVSGSVPGLANVARMTLEEADRSLQRLASPDAFSRTPDNEGRRIAPIEGGWLILNYTKYRLHRDPETRRAQNREAQRRQRAKQKTIPVSQKSAKVSQSQPESAQAEAEAEAVLSSKERTKELYVGLEAEFERARKLYPGDKRGHATEYAALQRWHKQDWQEVIPKLVPAIKREIAHKGDTKARGQFTPEWKNFKTWLYNRCWEVEFGKPPEPVDDEIHIPILPLTPEMEAMLDELFTVKKETQS